MGCGSSAANVAPNGDPSSVSVPVNWKVMLSTEEARAKYESMSSLPPGADAIQLEFRALLDEPVACLYIENYLVNVERMGHVLQCWMDILDFKTTPEGALKNSKALVFYRKYLRKESGSMCKHVESDQLLSARNKFEADDFRSGAKGAASTNSASSTANNGSQSSTAVSCTEFDWLLMKCFFLMYNPCFTTFRTTPEYRKMNSLLRKKYNIAKAKDFEYLKILGEGGFGMVCLVRKKSTGVCYAMKLQNKRGMYDTYKGNPWKVDYEKQAFASCTYPFIVELMYAFQTRTLAIMVMTLGTAGDLAVHLKALPGKRFPLARTKFYAAELVCALGYLHYKGLIYRDLKPCNVLLHGDGHIKLADFGAVVDVNGRTLGIVSAVDAMPVFAPRFKQSDELGGGGAGAGSDNGSSVNSENSVSVASSVHSVVSDAGDWDDEDGPLQRATSVIGTFGYMAPEMVMLITRRNSRSSPETASYSKAVDWWSFGVTVYRMATGKQAFPPTQMEKLRALSELSRTDPDAFHDQFEALFHVKYDVEGLVEEAEVLGKDASDAPSAAVETAPSKGAIASTLPTPVAEEHPAANSLPALVSLLKELLQYEELDRLGSGPSGTYHITQHPFFADIEWTQMETKQVDPPYVPEAEASAGSGEKSHMLDLKAKPMYRNLDAMVEAAGKGEWLKGNANRIQRYFELWSYSSPSAVLLEYEVRGDATTGNSGAASATNSGDWRNSQSSPSMITF